MKKTQRGITLIALIITVIVLLILAGTAIGVALNGGDIFEKSSQAREGWNMAVQNENSTLSGILSELNNVYDDFGVETIPEGMVARIGQNYFPTLQTAIDAVEENIDTTIVLLTSVSENITLPANKTATIKMRGNSIVNEAENPVITINGKLTINNGTINGTYTEKKATILINANGEINLSKTNVSRNSEEAARWETIELHGKLSIDSGTISSLNSNAICGYTTNDIINIGGTTEIVGGQNGSYPAVSNKGTLTMTGGRIKGSRTIGLTNRGTLTMSGGTITSGIQPAIGNRSGATAEITGGTISCSNFDSIVNNGTISISGNTQILSQNGTAIYNSSNLTILSGTIYSETEYSIYQDSGTAEISGTTDVSTDSTNSSYDTLRCNGGTITLLGGSIRAGSGYAINNNGGTVYLSNNCNVTGETYGTITPYSGT